MDPDAITKLAELARIDVSDDEVKELSSSISSILEYVDSLQKVAGDEEAPSVGAQYNVFREDEPTHEPGAFSEEILKEMPETKDGYLKVKRIL